MSNTTSGVSDLEVTTIRNLPIHPASVFVALFVVTCCNQGSQKSIYTADMDDLAASSTLNFTYVTNNLNMSKDVIKVCGLIWMAGPPRAWQELLLQCRNTSCEESD